MARPDTLSAALLDAIDEPALIVRAGSTFAANRAATALLGEGIVGRDVRFALRHPQILDAIEAAQDADIDLVGIGSAERPWHLTTRMVADGSMLVRLADRSPLVAAERMRTDFVANASHELRTPLATIIGFAETLAEDGAVDDALRVRFGTTIHDEARRMLRIVEDLMSLSRIEYRRFDPPADRVDLREVARLAIDQCGHLSQQRGCTVGLQTGDRPQVVRGDFTQLLQLTDNLIGNALRYGCDDRNCQVDVSVATRGSRAVLSVRDHGDGIAPEHLPRLTERFYRVDAARSRDAGGTGLGLAIVKHVVERHRGTLDVQSSPGTGTTISVALPLAPDAVTKL